jgi:hypothetical protein
VSERSPTADESLLRPVRPLPTRVPQVPPTP